jgi:glycosyltransferase involved in cell wall biosynthesis
LKVFFAIKSLSSSAGGAERVLCKIASLLAARGVNVSILTFDSPEKKPYYPLDKRIKKFDLNIGDSSSPAGFIETIFRIKALRRVISEAQPDVVVGFMHSMFVLLAFALLGRNIPILGSEHIVREHYRNKPFQYLLLILSAQFIKKITVLSEKIRSNYPNKVKSKMVVMPNPIELSTNLANIGSDKGNFTLLSVGRLDEQKDHSSLIQAFALIAKKFPQWNLKIIGEGRLRSHLEHLIKTLGMDSKVTLTRNTSLIEREYQSAEIFVIPSRYEAFGLVTAEAMAHGLPVIGFEDCPGTNELIRSGVTGLLVDPKNNRVHSLASALSSLMADPLLRKRLAASGHKAINKQFSASNVCDQWQRLLRDCICAE